MSNLRITPTESQTAENIIFDLLAEGRNTKRKRINSLKDEVLHFEYIIKDFSERLKVQRSIWYMGEIYLNSDLEAIKQEYKVYLQALEIVKSENSTSKPIKEKRKVNLLTINLGLENNPFRKELTTSGNLNTVDRFNDVFPDYIGDFLNLDFYDIDIQEQTSVKIGYKDNSYLGKSERTIIAQGLTPNTLEDIKSTVEGYCLVYSQECIAIEYGGKGYLIYNEKIPKNKRLKFDSKYFTRL